MSVVTEFRALGYHLQSIHHVSAVHRCVQPMCVPSSKHLCECFSEQ